MRVVVFVFDQTVPAEVDFLKRYLTLVVTLYLPAASFTTLRLFAMVFLPCLTVRVLERTLTPAGRLTFGLMVAFLPYGAVTVLISVIVGLVSVAAVAAGAATPRGEAVQQYVNDMYALLAHIPEMTTGNRLNWIATWVDAHDVRRLTAYTVLGAYRNNTRRFHLPDSLWVKPVGPHTGDELGNASAANYREYGDTALFIDAARSLLLGTDQIPTLDAKAGPDFVEWLDQWAATERLTQKLLEGEEHSIGDGDGVYALSWPTAKVRPVLRVNDPGFYFPVPHTVGTSRSSPTRCTPRGSGRRVCCTDR